MKAEAEATEVQIKRRTKGKERKDIVAAAVEISRFGWFLSPLFRRDCSSSLTRVTVESIFNELRTTKSVGLITNYPLNYTTL